MTSIQSAAANGLQTIEKVRDQIRLYKFLTDKKRVDLKMLEALENIYNLIINDKPAEAAKLFREYKDRSIVYQVTKDIKNYLNKN